MEGIDDSWSSEQKIQYFLKFVYDNYCECENSCFIPDNFVPTVPDVKKITQNCSMITISEDTEIDYLERIKIALGLFKSLGLLQFKNNKYYISPTIKLTWINLHKQDISNETKGLYWLFRKLVVNSIIQSILQIIDTTNVYVYSVGSVKLTSDYDLTIYGDKMSIVLIIRQFNRIFSDIFNMPSSIIFDTNIYGSSFIFFDKNPFVTAHKTCDKRFYYVTESSTYTNSQFKWGLIHLYKSYHTLFGNTNTLIWKTFEKNNEISKYIESVAEIYDYLNNSDTVYEEILLKDEPDILKMADNISLSNYFANESYFTRGAFLDIVVNNQMCKNVGIIDLTVHDYTQSIIENTAFWLLHVENTKYPIRVKNALEMIINKSKAPLTNVLQTLERNIQEITEELKKEFDFAKHLKFKNTIIIDITSMIGELLMYYIPLLSQTNDEYFTIDKLQSIQNIHSQNTSLLDIQSATSSLYNISHPDKDRRHSMLGYPNIYPRESQNRRQSMLGYPNTNGRPGSK